MKKYEMIHAIRSTCSGMLSSNVEEITADDLDLYVKEHVSEDAVVHKQELTAEGSVIYDILTRGVEERLTFTEL